MVHGLERVGVIRGFEAAQKVRNNDRVSFENRYLFLLIIHFLFLLSNLSIGGVLPEHRYPSDPCYFG